MSLKYAKILPVTYILILNIVDLRSTFYTRNVRTTMFFKVLLKHVFVKLILNPLFNEFQSFIFSPLRSRVRIPPEADILDSTNDFILTILFEFSVKSYRNSEIPKP